MDDVSKSAAFLLTGDADPLPSNLLESPAEETGTLALLQDVSRELTAILDREELLRRIAQRVKKLVNYHLFSVMLWDEKTQLLEGVFSMRYGDAIPARVCLSLGQGITGTAAAERRPVRVSDTRLDARYIGCETDTPVRSELVVPLFLQDRLIGVLDLESTETHAFTAEHERMLSTLGSFIAVALENARLYEEVRESGRRLHEDLSTAREIQRQLLPRGASEVPGLDLAAGYCSARELGGDFYDFLAYGEGRLALALGDVSGKGTAAALFGAMAIGIMREHVVEHPCPPAEMLAMLNGRLHAARLDPRFVALSFAIYDARQRTLTLANAGEPYPLLVRDGAVQPIEAAGLPLGLFPDSQYDAVEIRLRPGDLVVFASDGIHESENARAEQFAPEHLHRLLAGFSSDQWANAIVDQILAAVDSHAGQHTAPHDDRTLIALRVTDHTSADFSKLPIIY